MARIEPLAPPYPPAVAERLSRLLPPGMAAPRLFATVARNEGPFCRLVDMGLLGPTGLLDRRVLPAPLREALILRCCVAAGNAYEWNLHVTTIAARMGLGDAQIDDTRSDSPDPALWTEAERAALALADTLVRRLAVDDDLFVRLRRHFDAATLIEMTQLVGLYTGVAMLVALARPDFDAYGRPKPAERHKSVKRAGRPDSVRPRRLATPQP
jgi:4-carboxymuconolactone decarboxylase